MRQSRREMIVFANPENSSTTDDVLDLLSWRIQARFQIRCAANHLPQVVRLDRVIHVPIRPNNAITLSGIEWLWSAQRA